MKMAKLKFKEIQLFPTEFYLDVLVTHQEKIALEFLQERYLDVPLEDKEQILDTVRVLPLGRSINLCEPRIVLTLSNIKDKAVLAHEIVHIIWALSDIVGFEMNTNSQEWQAHMMSFLFREIEGISKNKFFQENV